jgi:thiol-disulfide isomerase/thioredoxin
MIIRRTGVVALVLLGALAGCVLVGCAPGSPGSVSAGAESSAASPFAACPTPARSGLEPAGNEGQPLPSVPLRCFTGGNLVDLSKLNRPLVINFWSSDCAPCRTEMPELQRFAADSAGRVVLVGVDTGDRWNAAVAAGIDFTATYPMLFDPDGDLLRAWGRNVKPVTLLVGLDGQVRHEDLSGALTKSTLDDLVQRYLGVQP